MGQSAKQANNPFGKWEQIRPARNAEQKKAEGEVALEALLTEKPDRGACAARANHPHAARLAVAQRAAAKNSRGGLAGSLTDSCKARTHTGIARC